VKTYAARLRAKIGVKTKVALALWASDNLGD
jgi:DNA-binding CsgD family transcriptional regulator